MQTLTKITKLFPVAFALAALTVCVLAAPGTGHAQPVPGPGTSTPYGK